MFDPSNHTLCFCSTCCLLLVSVSVQSSSVACADYIGNTVTVFTAIFQHFIHVLTTFSGNR